MHAVGVSTVNALTAHKEWATRPPDERYDSVHALHQAALTRRLSGDEHRVATQELVVDATSDERLAFRGKDGLAALTHWSFEQLATIAGAPPKYLRDASGWHRLTGDQPRIAAAAAHPASAVCRQCRTMDRARGHVAALCTRPPRRARLASARPHGVAPSVAVTARIQEWRRSAPNGCLRARISEIETCSCSWLTAIATSTIRRIHRSRDCSADSFFGTAMWEPQPCLWMCSCSASYAETTSSGASSTWLDSVVVTSERLFRKHGRTRSMRARAALDADTTDDRTMVARATTTELGGSREEVIQAVVRESSNCRRSPQRRPTTSRNRHERNPRSVWGFVQGLTRLSQQTPWQDGRFALDRAAGALLATVH